MVIAQILDLVKQYIIKGIIDLPSTENFQVTDLYHVAFILLFAIVLELIFSYISNITRTIHMVKKQTPYISEKLFNNLNKKTYSFFTDNYTGKISTAINEINDEITNLNTQITTKFISLLTSMVSSLIVLYTINKNIFIVATILFTGIIVSRLIYFSRADENYAVGYIEKGNTEIVAEYIRDIIEADLFKIEGVKGYSANYQECIEEAKERQQRNERPELKI